MKLGFISSIMDGYTFEEVMEFAGTHGFSCVELASWPHERAGRRYAGVTHMDADDLDELGEQRFHEICDRNQVSVSALAYYPNPMDEDPQKRERAIGHIEKLICAANRLGIGMVTTFAGRMQSKSVQENLRLFPKVWKPLVALAEEKQVKIAFENCPMLFTEDEWPGGQNLAVSPAVWREMFAMIDSPYLGLNYDPSHMVWQMMDYVQPVYEFSDKIFHAHIKDIKVYKDRLGEHGILAAPLSYMAPKLPGLGDVDWGKFLSALTDIGYEGSICLEIEDKAFEGSRSSIEQAILLGKRYVSQFIG